MQDTQTMETGADDRQSGRLIVSPVPSGNGPRGWYLAHPLEVSGPTIGASHIVPQLMVAHLMRRKKDLALGVKYEVGDAIVNMEGALHTLAVPVVHALMHGDYRYASYGRGHELLQFGVDETSGRQLAREVLISATIQPDFENDQVMMIAAALSDSVIKGRAGLKEILSHQAKENQRERAKYDLEMKEFMVYHLCDTQEFPGQQDVHPMLVKDALSTLERTIAEIASSRNTHAMSLEDVDKDSGSVDRTEELSRLVANPVANQYVRTSHGRVLSLSFLFNIAVRQIRAELTAITHLINPANGFVYTHDPPSIFAGRLGAPLITRLHCAALAQLASSSHEIDESLFRHMRVYAFNDYQDPTVPLFTTALQAHPHILVMSRRSLFRGMGYYSPPAGVEEALLVIHNNSDAFGQNIEFEGPGMSLDGTIGEGSSAAASLRRDRKDLLNNVLFT